MRKELADKLADGGAPLGANKPAECIGEVTGSLQTMQRPFDYFKKLLPRGTRALG